jgi:hypothetical protein
LLAFAVSLSHARTHWAQVKANENVPGFSATTQDGKELTVGPVGTALLWILLIVRPPPRGERDREGRGSSNNTVVE